MGKKKSGKLRRKDVSDEEEYAVDAIIDERDDGMLLVSWVGYPSSGNTWEPAANLPSAKVNAFRKSKKKLSTKKISGSRASRLTKRSGKREVASAGGIPAIEEGSQSGGSQVEGGANKTEGNHAEGCFGDQSEEYEVEAIVGQGDNGKLWVSWVGYEEKTLEPESNLPATMVKEFRGKQLTTSPKMGSLIETPLSTPVSTTHLPTRAEKTPAKQEVVQYQDAEGSSRGGLGGGSASLTTLQQTMSRGKRKATVQVSRETMCAICFDDENVGRRCVKCTQPVHHFCSLELCEKLGLAETEYDDICYCSKECYIKMKPKPTAAVGPTKPSNSPKPPRPPKNVPIKKITPTLKTRKMKTQKKYTPVCTQTHPLINSKVAFCPEHEVWMPINDYKKVGSMFLVGFISRTYRPTQKEKDNLVGDTEDKVESHAIQPGSTAQNKRELLFEVKWMTSEYQLPSKHVHRISLSKVNEGIENFERMNGMALGAESWTSLCNPYSEAMKEADVWDEFEEIENACVGYEGEFAKPIDQIDVEEIASMQFHANASLSAPTDLYAHPDGSTNTKLKPEFEHMFKHSASSSFFAFLPISFWKKVVESTNSYSDGEKRAAVSLEEMMKFLGVLFYMSIVDKGEYANYWGDQVEDIVFGQRSVSLDGVMSLRRFKHIRKNLCFRYDVTFDNLKVDPAARIRPLMNMIKVRGAKYVNVGRDIAVDESSVACRSRFGRHMIVFNPKKPTGKYHFKIYMLCCSTSWMMLSFRLHAGAGTGLNDVGIVERLRGVISDSSVSVLQSELSFSERIRQIVIETTLPMHHTKRVVNTDNFYTSCTLLEALKLKGLYCRGTIRSDSMHAPRCIMYAKNDNMERGSMRQGVNVQHKIIAASWVDGNVVNILSNADDSSIGQVERLIKQTKTVFRAPSCIANYNNGMQGVDRFDQLRARFSLADGHSFRKWHKKLAMAFIDIARVNAFICRKLSGCYDGTRDPHRVFMNELTSDLLNGDWAKAIGDSGLLFNDPTQTSQPSRPTASSPAASPIASARSTVYCTGISSNQVFPNSRPKRECIVCRYEGRYPTETTLYCSTHNAALCARVHDVQFNEAFCQDIGATCWQKFHSFYLPNGLFNEQGRIRRSSKLYKEKKQAKSGQVQLTVDSPFQGSDISTDHGPVSPHPGSPYPGHESTDYGASPRVPIYSTDDGEPLTPQTCSQYHHESTDYGVSPHTSPQRIVEESLVQL